MDECCKSVVWSSMYAYLLRLFLRDSGHRACVHGEGAPVPASVGRRRLVPLEIRSEIGEDVEPPMFCRLLTSNHRQTLGNQELK